MSVVCGHCNAKNWPGESAGLCCSDGKVQLPPFQELPAPLKSLLEGSSPDSKHFLAKIRQYNCTFQMTSSGGNAFREVSWNPTFKFQGQVYHRIGSLLPETAIDSAFPQIYFIADYNQQGDARIGIILENDTGQHNHPRRDIIMCLQQMLHEINSYVRSFKYALKNNTSSDFIIVIDADKWPQREHVCKYINKETDAAMFGIRQEGSVDEIQDFLAGRVISSTEGPWHIFSFPIHERFPAIVQLTVHLENDELRYFSADAAMHVAARTKDTTLTAFFKLCRQDEFARTLLGSAEARGQRRGLSRRQKRRHTRKGIHGSPIATGMSLLATPFARS
ncbi:unnamed protein product [Acanthosepion pharaonis]|uniref:Uncharacterized protein n=1 Tax=Acanthosepion pharaonis TaxID=158019 RepID=A0A812EQL6_ACAPH|nr:unnamed protein product [Sepia pharaonis]